MKSLTTAGKMLAVSSAVLFSTMIGGVAAADSTTNTTIVPNTTACSSTAVSENSNGGTFSAKWNNDNTFTITVTKAPTSNVTLYASSYHLTSPDYKGGCFGSTGSYPQTYDNNTQTIVIAKGFTGTKNVALVMPTSCYNEQADLYFGYGYGNGYTGAPLNSTVGASGHNYYNYIAGNIMPTANNVACQPGKGGDTPVPPTTTTTTPTTPQVLSDTTVAPAAAQLTDTGLNIWATSLLAVATMAGAIFVARKKAVVTTDAQ